ncbi:glycosyl hydrolase family 28-related protein [Desertivirga brevis]|uniref:glycosyl hydrolase family 28-related protein n=1 Tax=Desertivirga brevis TaxID=2810310 RepID=UPI001A95D268|nr:glycosyl hydrolase family 28-related protein [Pedobacter sp. SYSU D00873]
MKRFYRGLLVFTALSFFACKKDNINPIEEQEFEIPGKVGVVSVNGISLDGDGLTDSRTQLQSLVNAAASKNEVLILPQGKFRISDEIILPSNTSIEGAGDGTEIVLTGGSTSNRNVFRVPTRTSNIKIKNIRLNANQGQNTGSRLAALYVTDNTSGIYAEGVTFIGSRDGGSAEVKGMNAYPVVGLSFINCWFAQGGRSDLEIRGAKDVVIKGNYFENWAGQGALSPAIALTSQDNSNVSISGNTFINSIGSLGAIQSTAAVVTGAKIEGNIFNDAKNIGGNGVIGAFNSSTVINNNFGGSLNVKNGGINLTGTDNIITPNNFSVSIYPYTEKVSAGSTGGTTTTPATTTPIVPAPVEAPAPVVPDATTVTGTLAPNAFGLNGDGSTNNRTVLQNLINSFASKGQTLVLPAGKFLISDEIIIPSNASIEGQGESTEIFLSNGTASGRRVFRVPTQKSNIKIKNIKLNANFAGNTGGQLVAMFVTDNVKTVYFENVSFSGSRDAGTLTVKGLNAYQVTNLSLINCKFTDAGRSAVELRGTKEVTATGNQFTRWGLQNNNSPAFQLQSQDNINVNISGNTFNNTHGIQFAIECAAAYVRNATIANNTFNDPNNLGGNGISGYFRYTTITKNVMNGGVGNHRSGLEIFGPYNTMTYNTISAGSIAISGGIGEDATMVTIANNTVKTKGANTGGIQLGGGGYNLNNVKITDNIVDTRLSTGNSSAIVLGTYNATRVVSDITVSGNTVYTNAHCVRAQALAGSKNIYISNNNWKAGYTWLGMITNTFSNIVVNGNINELANKIVSYSVSMTPIAVN